MCSSLVGNAERCQEVRQRAEQRGGPGKVGRKQDSRNDRQ